MKNFKRIFATAIVLVTFSAAANAQASATATATANIVTPISITKNVDMNFGNIAVSASVGGTVILSSAGGRTLGGTGLTLPAVPGTVTAADFTVNGTASYTYDITLPASVTLTGAGAPMVANAFTCSIGLTAGALGTGGTQNFSVGATLAVAAGQVAGSYTSAAPFTVTVNYN